MTSDLQIAAHWRLIGATLDLQWSYTGSAGDVQDGSLPSIEKIRRNHKFHPRKGKNSMAIVDLGPLLQGVHGKIGDLVFRRGPDGKTIVSKAPQKKKKKSKKAQKAEKARNARQRQLMYEAHDYARAAMANPEMRAHYEKQARRKRKKAYSLAFAGFFEAHRKLGE
jgi:hypothetical protein